MAVPVSIAVSVSVAAHGQPREPIAIWATDSGSRPLLPLLRAGLERRSIDVRTLDDLGAAPPRASAPPADARAALADAVSRYGGAELEEALAIIERLEADLAAWVDGDRVALGQLFAWKAACLAKLRRADEARAYFALAIRLGAAPDPNVLSPDVMALVPSSPSLPSSGAQLEVLSRPAGARIELDGGAVDARAPASLDVGTGLHLVVVRATGRVAVARVASAPGRVELAGDALEGDALRGALARRRDDGALEGASSSDVVSVLTAIGATRAITVTTSGDDSGRTRLVMHDASGEELERAVADTRASADVDRAIARLLGETSPSGARVSAPSSRRRPRVARTERSTSVFERWWFWGAVGLVVGGAVVTGAAVASSGGDTFRVVVATPR